MRAANTETPRKLLRGFPPHILAESGLNANGPTFVSIHMEPKCNFACRKCFMEREPLVETNPRLEMAEIETILVKAEGAGARVFSITGAGEPLMGAHTLQAVDIAHQLGMTTLMATNGSLADEKTLVFLKEKGVTLAFSIDTVDPKEYAKRTGTAGAMLEKVMHNFRTAQEIFRGTKTVEAFAGETLELFRLFVHATLSSSDGLPEVEAIRRIFDPETALLSVSPVAGVGSAKENGMRPPSSPDALTERHIVVIRHPQRGTPICGFFAFGIDMNFDGNILLDAHAGKTAGLLKNIRDFGLDPALAFAHSRPSKERFMDRFLDGGFCPVRAPRLDEYVDEETVINHIAKGQSLLKFAYLGAGAGRFMQLLESAQYTTGRNEQKIIDRNSGRLQHFINGRDAVVLGVGSGCKLAPLVSSARSSRLLDISPEMLSFAVRGLDKQADAQICDFEMFDFSKCAPGTVFVILGNTLANLDDIPAFLERVAAVEGARILVGMELLDKRSATELASLKAAYSNEADFEFIFTPLERLGVKHEDGKVGIGFNKRLRRIEGKFSFSDENAKERFCSAHGLEPAEMDGILLGVSAKMSRRDFLEIAKKAGFGLEGEFREGRNHLFCLERRQLG
ncbi:MAG: L-histidine N(alpha)-methyltransferase [Candidatus Burarchaeum sp.]|nr:L-histidine N(alpha)-methyltransferase [Candidatus Burarchaeum sp.]MDO8340008.1 L-histidine N(alpha)-methyltransferase [Candidatus Burarchaeum sp.]